MLAVVHSALSALSALKNLKILADTARPDEILNKDVCVKSFFYKKRVKVWQSSALPAPFHSLTKKRHTYLSISFNISKCSSLRVL